MSAFNYEVYENGMVILGPKEKMHRLLDFSHNPRDIADPWFTGNFDVTYDDIVEGLEAFLDFVVLFVVLLTLLLA